MATTFAAKFPLGRCLATPGALEALEEAQQQPGFFIDRHVQGDWGEIDPEDVGLNDQALIDETRIFSVYRTLLGERLWVITEADRAATTILLPEEY